MEGELDALTLVDLGGGLNGSGGGVGVGKAAEVVLVEDLFGVEGDLDVHDINLFGELLVHVLADEVLGELPHEHILHRHLVCPGTRGVCMILNKIINII